MDADPYLNEGDNNVGYNCNPNNRKEVTRMSEKVEKMKVEFQVEGNEDYYVCLEFRKVRAAVVEVVGKIFESYAQKLADIIAAPNEGDTVKYVQLDLQVTGQPPVKMRWENVPLKTVFALEYTLVEAQKLMLDETSKL